MKHLFAILVLASALLFGASQASAITFGGPGFYVQVPPYAYVGPPYYPPYYGPPYYGPPYYGPPYYPAYRYPYGPPYYGPGVRAVPPRHYYHRRVR